MSPIPSPFLLKKWSNHACIYMKIKMSNNNNLIKMSTYTNYLGQVHNYNFNKTSHRQVKIFKNIT